MCGNGGKDVQQEHKVIYPNHITHTKEGRSRHTTQKATTAWQNTYLYNKPLYLKSNLIMINLYRGKHSPMMKKE